MGAATSAVIARGDVGATSASQEGEKTSTTIHAVLRFPMICCIVSCSRKTMEQMRAQISDQIRSIYLSGYQISGRQESIYGNSRLCFW